MTVQWSYVNRCCFAIRGHCRRWPGPTVWESPALSPGFTIQAQQHLNTCPYTSTPPHLTHMREYFNNIAITSRVGIVGCQVRALHVDFTCLIHFPGELLLKSKRWWGLDRQSSRADKWQIAGWRVSQTQLARSNLPGFATSTRFT